MPGFVFEGNNYTEIYNELAERIAELEARVDALEAAATP